MIIPKSLREAFNKTKNKTDILGTETQSGFDDMKDYLAQKFTAAYLRAESPEEVKRLANLWNAILHDDDEHIPPEQMMALMAVMRGKEYHVR